MPPSSTDDRSSRRPVSFEQAQAIVAALEKRTTIQAIADITGIDRKTISRIKHGEHPHNTEPVVVPREDEEDEFEFTKCKPQQCPTCNATIVVTPCVACTAEAFADLPR